MADLLPVKSPSLDSRVWGCPSQEQPPLNAGWGRVVSFNDDALSRSPRSPLSHHLPMSEGSFVDDNRVKYS